MKQDIFPHVLERDLQCYTQDCECVDQAVQSLEAIVTTQDIMTSGEPGLNDTAYRLIQHSVESFLLLGRIGTPVGTIVPSMESFNGKYDLGEATLEGIGAGIKNVFQSILDAIKKAIAWMGGLIKRLFGRGKEHDEKIAKIKHDVQDVKEKTNNLSERELKSAPTRGPDGFFTEVPMGNAAMLRRLVTSKGLMDQETINEYIKELNYVFEQQPKNLQYAENILKNGTSSGVHYDAPFDRAHDQAIVKQVSKVPTDKVFTSREFGAGEFIYVCWPDQKGPTDMSWLPRFSIGKVTAARIPEYKQFKTLTGDFTNPDKLIEILVHFNKEVQAKQVLLDHLQATKTRVIKELEARIRKEGVMLFTAPEKKQERNQLTMFMKYFNKVMDQPAVMYWAECDRIINALEHLAMHVLAFNRRNGNMVQLKD